ncbi:uncharacterized protein BJ212DRAFT_1434007 [Suillus subaureus]|uniref:Uncharacterized protein n=1 Tax=Suillus subaureus TaxID=48587 RepID=A0A9P7JBE0_9AGAM|nr:uncharacterized protein BJ212DRAFT_1434007 [Suillus subaureus]KAG1812575.1 hypothetical protein BJ212DRAFT_1434007 [Suillus subaureus]
MTPFASHPTLPMHCDTAELTEEAPHDDRSSTPFLLESDSGWMVGLNRRLLFWVPSASRHPFYSPGTVLVVTRGGPELDLSCMAHGRLSTGKSAKRNLDNDDRITANVTLRRFQIQLVIPST